ncbi:MAG: methionine--tRNA ligase subunit beta [Planctomycetes bacterium]|nr:methionine--tRNA ligase subunit beta [Planctomycetota bacterium]
MADETPAVASELVSIADFRRLDLRIAKILEARPHPNADRLVLLKVDVGGQQKQIIAGIRAWYTPESLVGRSIVVVNNLQPAMLRGEESNGMLLAATSGDQVILLTPDRECLSGAKIS